MKISVCVYIWFQLEMNEHKQLQRNRLVCFKMHTPKHRPIFRRKKAYRNILTQQSERPTMKERDSDLFLHPSILQSIADHDVTKYQTSKIESKSTN